MGWASSSLLAAIVASALAIPAYAQRSVSNTAKSMEAFDQCINSGDARMGVMPAILDCYRDEISRKDEVLNNTYRDVRKSLAPVKQKQLQVLERRWIAQRDKKCKAEVDGSQDGVILWYGCVVHETEQRIEWLKDFARKA
jgi:uncharacterized protein YecT (DUF1311 family)